MELPQKKRRRSLDKNRTTCEITISDPVSGAKQESNSESSNLPNASNDLSSSSTSSNTVDFPFPFQIETFEPLFRLYTSQSGGTMINDGSTKSIGENGISNSNLGSNNISLDPSSNSSTDLPFPFQLETFEPFFRLLQAKILANGQLTSNNLNFLPSLTSPGFTSPSPPNLPNPTSIRQIQNIATSSLPPMTSRQLNESLRKKLKQSEESEPKEKDREKDKEKRAKKLQRSGKEPYECPECHKMFSHKNSLTSHRRLHTGTKPFKCIECLKTFNYKGSLTKHMKSHLTINEKPYKCIQCNKSFAQKGHLRVHMYTHNGYEQVFRCPECKRVFVHKHELTLHMRRHTGENPYKCTHCNKTFVSSFILKQHMCMCTGEKPYKCTECLETFYRFRHLKQHMLSHTGEKHFKCQECDKAFTQSESLKTHMTLHTMHAFSVNPPT